MWQETGRDEGVPLPPSVGVQAAAPGTARGACPGIPSQAGDPCVQRQVRAAGYSQPGTGPAALGPALALLQGAAWGSQQHGEGRRGWPPGTVGTRGWESEQRTRGRMERRGTPWHRDTNARTGASGAKTQTSERRGRGSEAGGPCPARAFVHGWRSAAPAPPGAEVLQSN